MNRISLVFTILVVSFVIISYETTEAFTGGGIVGRGIGRSERDSKRSLITHWKRTVESCKRILLTDRRMTDSYDFYNTLVKKRR